MASPIVVGWPASEAWRKIIQIALQSDLNVPAYEDSTTLNCQECGIQILIGPRQAALMWKETKTTFTVLCGICVTTREVAGIANLGNPDDLANP